MASKQRSAIHAFNIDDYLNRFIPRPRFYLLPQSISRWFGYRAPPKGEAPAPVPATSVLLVWLFSFLGGFIGIAIIENVFRNLPLLGGQPAPLIIASFGAAAILEYNAIESPLSQPRNLILGHFLAACIGVGITKLFQLLPNARFEDLRWVAGALAVGVASTVMGITKTVHPPAGATALLAATTPEVTVLGWWLLPLVLLAASLMLVSAMLVNNLYKRFPLYWWTPLDLAESKKDDIVKVKDAEKEDAEKDDYDSSIDIESDTGLPQANLPSPSRTLSHAGTLYKRPTLGRSNTMASRKSHFDPQMKIQIELDRIVVPDWMELSQWEAEVLEGFQVRLRSGTRDE